RPLPESEGPFLGVDWIDGYRQQRIVEVLQAGTPADRETTSALQIDRLSLPWREMREIVLAAATGDRAADRAARLLRNWDGRLEADSAAATVFEFFVAEMTRRIVAAKAPRSAPWALGRGFTPLVPHTLFSVNRVGQLVKLLRDQPDGWLERAWTAEIADV